VLGLTTWLAIGVLTATLLVAFVRERDEDDQELTRGGRADAANAPIVPGVLSVGPLSSNPPDEASISSSQEIGSRAGLKGQRPTSHHSIGACSLWFNGDKLGHRVPWRT
jgi:hypothetical protein